MYIAKVIKKYLTSEKYRLILLGIIQVIASYVAVLIPYILGKYIDKLILQKDIKYIVYFGISFLGVYIISSIGTYLNTILLTRLKNKLFYSISSYSIDCIINTKYSEMSSVDMDYITEQISGDTNIIVEFIFGSIFNCIMNIMQLICIFFIVIKINFATAIIFLISIPLYCIVYILYKGKLYKVYNVFRDKTSRLYSVTNEIVSRIWFIKAHSLYKEMNSKYEKSYNSYIVAALHHAKVNVKFNIMQNGITSLIQIIIFMYCGILIIIDNLTIGSFTVLNNYFNFIIGRVTVFLNISSNYQEFRVAKNRMENLLCKIKDDNGLLIVNEVNKIKCKDISFSYGDNKLINKFNYEFEKGSIYCISGENGVGKSTLINLLLFIEQEYTGEILFDDININKINMIDTRKNIVSIVEQFPEMLNESIEDNIKIISSNIANYIFSNVEFINNKNNVENLSGGEIKKIALIRAFLKKSNILILDEPETNLDDKSIKELVENLKEISKSKIIILITHSNKFDSIITNRVKL